MNSIAFSDPSWQSTFPHWVTPTNDEWLTGLLLRCDEVNHWTSGETLRYLHTTQYPGFGRNASLIFVPFPILECLAQLLKTTPECLLETTYAKEFRRLYGESHPKPILLHGLPPYILHNRTRHQFGQRMSIERKIHLCPKCIAQTRTIGRSVVLPHLLYCPIHQIAFQERCVCGWPLKFFVRGRTPFTCYACGLDWARWPHIPIPLERKALEEEMSALYALFLAKGTAELRVKSLRLARRIMKQHEPFELKLTGRKIMHPATYALHQLSLGYVIDILVTTGITPYDILN